MSPFRIDTQDSEGDWNFAEYAYSEDGLKNILISSYAGVKIRISRAGTLYFERDGETINNFDVN